VRQILTVSFALYVARRIAQAVPMVFVIILVNFFLIHAAPGDPVDILAGTLDADQAYLERLREEFGLNEPLWVQFWTYVGKVVQFDLGYSLRFRQDVLNLILERMPATFLLMGTALVISSVLGTLLGVIAARNPAGLLDNATTLIAIGGFSMPVFWLGQILLLVFALQLQLFPVQGMVSLRAPSEGFDRVLDIAHHLVLPALTYSVYHLTLIFRLTRVKMQETMDQDFIVTARAKGLTEGRVVYVHGLRNALLPIVTIIGLNFGFMLAGSVLTETVFAWPGMGRLMFEGINARDYPLLLGLFTVISLMVIAANVITDIAYAMIDPRVVFR